MPSPGVDRYAPRGGTRPTQLSAEGHGEATDIEDQNHPVHSREPLGNGDQRNMPDVLKGL